MNLEVLMSVMNQDDDSIIEKANLKSDAIIINQADTFEYAEVKRSNFEYKIYTFAERGVGKSRNAALMRSTADICLVADDDIVYNNDFRKTIIDNFEKYPTADMILFDIKILEKTGYRKAKNKNEKINSINFMKHGGPKIAFKRESILKKNIFFSLLFGGGAKYGSGEDSLFIKEALDKGLNVISVSDNIGEIDNRESTWFTGFNEKYLVDRGALFKALFPKNWYFISIQFVIRHHKKFENISKSKMLSLLVEGAKGY